MRTFRDRRMDVLEVSAIQTLCQKPRFLHETSLRLHKILQHPPEFSITAFVPLSQKLVGPQSPAKIFPSVVTYSV
jgi:hypothetical protein